MSFKDESWEQRFKSLGDEAEGVFASLADNSLRYGLDRPDYPLYWLSPVMRYTPDYHAALRGCIGLFEVQGCGGDQTIKLKEDKFYALEVWNDCIETVYMFFWNSTLRQWAVVAFDDLFDVYPGLVRSKFPEGKPYREIPWNVVCDIAMRSGEL